MVCRDAPDAIRRAGIDALLVDQMEPAGGAVAEHLGIPFVTVCNALAINRDPVAPPPFTDWTYRNLAVAPDPQPRGVRRLGLVDAANQRPWQSIGPNGSCRPLQSPDESFSRLAQICQMPREFDFPRIGLPETFHYVGPLRGAPLRPVPFPWERLNGSPIVYASLGTLQNSRAPVFRCFAEACRDWTCSS